MADGAASHRPRWVVAAVVAVVALAVGLTWALTSSGGDGTSSDAATGQTLPTRSSHPGHHFSSPSPGTSFTPGSGHTVPEHAARTKKAVPLRQPANFGTGLSVRITGITPVQGHATQPGEVSGPALKIRIVARNSSARPISLDGATVFVSYGGDSTPAEELSQGEHRFTGSVAAHGSQSATYVFQVPPSERGDVRVQVSYSGKAPVVALEGAA